MCTLPCYEYTAQGCKLSITPHTSHTINHAYPYRLYTPYTHILPRPIQRHPLQDRSSLRVQEGSLPRVGAPARAYHTDDDIWGL